MRLLILITLMIGSFVVIPQTARADWVEARSDNFVFVGDASEKRAEKIVSELEQYRAIIFTLFRVEADNEIVPVRIYATKSQRDIADMTGSINASGVYTTRRESPVFILNIKGGFSDKSPAKAIALHEYTHHLLAQHTEQLYPRWVNEGMAEYLSTFTASKNGKIRIGLPKDGRGRTLAVYDWMDWDVIFGSIRRYPFPNDGSRNTEIGQQLFYAQSWLAVHYIQSTPGLAEKLSQYIKGVPQAVDSRAYFAKIFEMTGDEFGEKLQAYFKRNSYPGRRVTLPDAIKNVPITVRQLDKGEVEFQLGEAIRQFRSHEEEGRTLAVEHYDKAESKGGPIAQIEASRALIAIANGKTVDARTHIARAQSLDQTDSRIMHIAGKVKLEEYRDGDIPSTTADMKAVRSLFKKAMRANPHNIEAHFDYVMTYAETGDSPSKQAIESAMECTYHYRSAAFFAENMGLASVLLNAGEFDYARYHIQRATLWAPSPGARRSARRMLERLP